MGEYEGCNRRPDEMCWIHIDAHERERGIYSIDAYDVRVHDMVWLYVEIRIAPEEKKTQRR